MSEDHAPVTTDWMETQSGLCFDAAGRIDNYTRDDMVWGCARASRYNGQYRRDVEMYSVAEHLVLMARWLLARKNHILDLGMHPVDFREHVRAAACHDLPEGIIGDMVRPLKRGDTYYNEIEGRLSRRVAERYRLMYPWPALVKELDNRILVDERRQVMNPSRNVWASDSLEPLGVEVKFWLPSRAAAELSALLDELEVHD